MKRMKVEMIEVVCIRKCGMSFRTPKSPVNSTPENFKKFFGICILCLTEAELKEKAQNATNDWFAKREASL